MGPAPAPSLPWQRGQGACATEKAITKKFLPRRKRREEESPSRFAQRRRKGRKKRNSNEEGGTAINNSCAEERTGSKRRSELRHHKRHSWRPADYGAHTSEQPLIARGPFRADKEKGFVRSQSGKKR